MSPESPVHVQGAPGRPAARHGQLSAEQGRALGATQDQDDKAFEMWQQLLAAGSHLVPTATAGKSPLLTADGQSRGLALRGLPKFTSRAFPRTGEFWLKIGLARMARLVQESWTRVSRHLLSLHVASH